MPGEQVGVRAGGSSPSLRTTTPLKSAGSSSKSGPGLAAELGDLAVGEDDARALDVVGRRPVAERARAGGVEPDHPADRPRLGAARVGAEPPAERGELRVQDVEHHARLHDDAGRARSRRSGGSGG